jgi:hypothetical protein
MKINTSLLLLCASALHADAQVSITLQAGPPPDFHTNAIGSYGWIWPDPQLYESSYSSVLQGPENGKNVMSINNLALCSNCSGSTQTQFGTANATIADTMYIKSVGVASLSVSTTVFVDTLQYHALLSSSAACLTSTFSSPYHVSGGCVFPKQPAQLVFPVSDQVKITASALAVLTVNGSVDTGNYNAAVAEVDNIVPLDKYGNPMSKVIYCTASGRPLPVQNGIAETCFPYKWIVNSVSFQAPPNGGSLYVNDPYRQLYVPQTGSAPKIQVFNADTLAPSGEIFNVDAAGVTVSTKSQHGFSSSNPVLMWDAVSLRTLSSIPLAAGVKPGAILLDPVNDLVYLFHQEAPLATILRASDGSTVGQVTLTGIAKEAVTDGKGSVYAGVQTADGYDVQILGFQPNGVLGVVNNWFLAGETCSGIAMEGANAILFATCKTPAATPAPPSSTETPAPPQMPYQLTAFQAGRKIPNSETGVFAASVGAVFNSHTGEVFSLQTDGPMTIVKEVNAATFQEEQFLAATTLRANSLALDANSAKVFFTGEGVSTDNQAESFLYQLMPARQ